jgi:enamine deaminase RidA (YjgF/YER057c/UK114 family)
MSDEASSDTPHTAINPDTMLRPVGFSHVVAAGPGRMVFVAGQAGHRGDGTLAGSGMVEQFDRAAENVVEALRAAGAGPEHLTSIQIFVTDAAAYRHALKELGRAYRRHFGRHFPAMGLFEVSGLFDPEAKVELMCIAVVPPPTD